MTGRWDLPYSGSSQAPEYLRLKTNTRLQRVECEMSEAASVPVLRDRTEHYPVHPCLPGVLPDGQSSEGKIGYTCQIT